MEDSVQICSLGVYFDTNCEIVFQTLILAKKGALWGTL